MPCASIRRKLASGLAGLRSLFHVMQIDGFHEYSNCVSVEFVDREGLKSRRAGVGRCATSLRFSLAISDYCLDRPSIFSITMAWDPPLL